MPKLIAEGGVAGHLAHLYDNRGLTFEKIAEILSAASKGELVGTEKTDGFNIYLGYKNGEAKAARNKGDMQRGGMNAVDLAMREFAGGPEIKKVYVDAFNAFGMPSLPCPTRKNYPSSDQRRNILQLRNYGSGRFQCRKLRFKHYHYPFSRSQKIRRRNRQSC